KEIKNLSFVCFTEYYDGIADSSRADVSIVFEPINLANLFGQYLADKGMNQLRIAETEKFAHVTFFFNGQSDQVFKNEDRILVPSPKVATYDLKPEMSAYEVKDKTIEAVESGKYDVIILNFANPDMVGHTGVYEAALKACEVVDECVGEVVDAVLKKDGTVLLTADHGNAEQMQDYITGEPMTAHTSNLVWLSMISKNPELQNGKVRIKPAGGKLADLIPTMIDIMGLEKPEEINGESLIQKV
ncbi:MAG: alkaline phosphatase family protein, partial [Spirochaetes bacterium]|nr:alkaline phosphatase family protein [Spirochaetota bacterium]